MMPTTMLCSTVLRRDLDQIAAVVDALDLHARRQNVELLMLVDLGSRRASMVGKLCSPRRIRTMPSTMSSSLVLAGDAEPRLLADGDRRRCRLTSTGVPLVAADHGVAQVVDGADQTDAAHDGGLRTDIDGIAADVDVASC